VNSLVGTISLFRTLQDQQQVQTLQLTLVFDQEAAGRWAGTCVQLGVSAYGSTLEDAQSDLRDAVLLDLNEMGRLGFEEAYLRDRGIGVASQPLKPKQPSRDWELAGIAPR
jgi:hypothetical protein